MKRFTRKNLYLLLVTLLLGALTSVIYAAQLNVDTFDANAQVSDVDTTACTTATGSDMLGGVRHILVTRTSGLDTVAARVDTTVPDSLAFSIGSSTRGTALIQMDGTNDGDCVLDFGLGGTSLNPYDGLTVFVRQVDLSAIVTMRIYEDASNYSQFSYTLPYAISAPGTELYFPFSAFTNVGTGADYGSIEAIEVLLDGTTIDSLDMTIDFVSADYSRDYGDLPVAYNNTVDADNGARHRIGAIYLGTGVDSEDDGQESATATGDQARTNDETGITHPPLSNWGDGTASLAIDLTKPSSVFVGCLVGWIDWDGDNVFETSSTGGVSEMVANTFLFGDQTINFTSPTTAQYGGTYPSTLNARFRIFRPNEPLFSAFGLSLDGAGCPTASTTASVLQLVFGEATDGEVEDYQWSFSPTAITLNNLNIASPQGVFPGVLVLTAGLFTIATFVAILKRRRSAL